MHGSMTRS